MDEMAIKKIMPNNIEAEKSVLSSILIDQDALYVASEIISGKDFYNAVYGKIFETMVEMNGEGKNIDLITLSEELKSKNLPEEITSMDVLDSIMEYSATSVNIKQYANIVKEKSLRRSMIKTNERIAKECYSDSGNLEDIMSEAETAIFNMSQNKGETDFVPIDKVVMNALDKIEATSKMGGTLTGLSTGFIDLDRQTSGLQPSDLIIVAARPSMGKTAFVLNIAEDVAIKKKKSLAIFSLEMSKEQLVNRIFSLESGVDAQAIRTGNLKDAEWIKLIEAADSISKSGLIIDDTPSISIGELRSKCKKYKIEHDISLVMIDYIQLMTGRKGESESRQNEISAISRELKAIARELNVPVIALSQLSRAVEKRDDKRPMLSDLRESGGIEQDADLVMFIYRDEYYNKEASKEPGVAEIIVAKQRNGPVGTVKLAWLGNLTKFVNREKKHETND